jgi:hypothetical protein
MATDTIDYVATDQIGLAVVSFDHLVGSGQQGFRDGDAERLGGLHVDHQFELCRLLNGQVGRLGAFEDPP